MTADRSPRDQRGELRVVGRVLPIGLAAAAGLLCFMMFGQREPAPVAPGTAPEPATPAAPAAGEPQPAVSLARPAGEGERELVEPAPAAAEAEAVTWTGTLFDEAGRPLPYTMFTARLVDDRPPARDVRRMCVSDPRGRFQVGGLPLGCYSTACSRRASASTIGRG